MEKVSGTLEFSAQMLSDLCRKLKISSCAVVTSLKDTRPVFSFCEALCSKMTETGSKAILTRADSQDSTLKKAMDGGLELVFAPHPDQSMDSFRACSHCGAVVLVEQYGVTRHKAIDEMTEFLRSQNVKILGVIGLKG